MEMYSNYLGLGAISNYGPNSLHVYSIDLIRLYQEQIWPKDFLTSSEQPTNNNTVPLSGKEKVFSMWDMKRDIQDTIPGAICIWNFDTILSDSFQLH